MTGEQLGLRYNSIKWVLSDVRRTASRQTPDMWWRSLGQITTLAVRYWWNHNDLLFCSPLSLIFRSGCLWETTMAILVSFCRVFVFWYRIGNLDYRDSYPVYTMKLARRAGSTSARRAGLTSASRWSQLHEWMLHECFMKLAREASFT